jgi:hypothetical protein
METQIYEDIVLVLGLQGEFRGQCLPPGDASVFAAVDIAWFAFFAKLSLSREVIFETFTAILYDIILYSTVTERREGIPNFEEVNLRALNVLSLKRVLTQSFCRAGRHRK